MIKIELVLLQRITVKRRNSERLQKGTGGKKGRRREEVLAVSLLDYSLLSFPHKCVEGINKLMCQNGL